MRAARLAPETEDVTSGSHARHPELQSAACGPPALHPPIDIDTSGDRDVLYIGEYFSGIASNDIGTGLGPRVTVMTGDGDVLSRVGTEAYGSQVGRFFSPHGVAVDSHGDLYVAEVANTDYGVPWRVKQELRSLQKLVRLRD